jgi:hypothetical protein
MNCKKTKAMTTVKKSTRMPHDVEGGTLSEYLKLILCLSISESGGYIFAGSSSQEVMPGIHG